MAPMAKAIGASDRDKVSFFNVGAPTLSQAKPEHIAIVHRLTKDFNRQTDNL